MATSGSTYPGKDFGPVSPGVPAGTRDTIPKYPYPIRDTTGENPSLRTGAVLGMMPFWQVINICVGGTKAIRTHAEQIIPREPEEPDDAYQRRIFHAVMPPFVQRLAAQAAGTILRKGINLEGGDTAFWAEWSKDVTGDGTPLNELARRLLVDALLYGHTSLIVDYPDDAAPRTLLEERQRKDRKPYLVQLPCQQILGWRIANRRTEGALSQVRYVETVVEPTGAFGEDVIEQIRVLEPGSWRVYRSGDGTDTTGWKLHSSGSTPLSRIPLVTVYSNRLATLVSRPPLLEVAYMNLAYCQRFTDYHHAIHVGSQPILCFKGFDDDSGKPIGLSVNTAVLLPPDGDAMYVEPTAAAYDAQLKCLQTMEEQISTLGVSTLAKQNITNAAAEAKRLDRIDSDSIMAIISEDLARAIGEVVELAAEYAGVEAPEVTIPHDYENRLLDGNQITAMLQLQMQNVISQETLLRILQEGEVLPPYINLDEELTRTRDQLEEQMQQMLDQQEAQMELQQEHAPPAGPGGGASSGKASSGGTKGSMTLPTPMRPGKHAS